MTASTGNQEIVILFRTQLRPEAAGREYDAAAARMVELVRTMPGFVSVKNYTGTDGDRLTLVRFDSEAAVEAWRNHPEHRAVQTRAREFFYDSYWVQVCRTIREYSFTRPSERASSPQSQAALIAE